MAVNPKVSIIMLTYNHAPYLKEAIEGVLRQKTNFPFEIIICNDASPDNSDELLNDYAQKYPGIIRYFRHSKNIGFVENQRFAFQKAQGKYIAYCEGDDYWTDETKLQFQYDFLEAYPEYSMTTARNKLLHQNTGKLTDDGKDYIFGNKEFVDYDLNTFFKNRPTQTFTYLIRKDFLDMKWVEVYPNYRDLYYFYHLLQKGKGRAFNKIIGVYRLHDGGVYSSLETEKKLLTSIGIFTNLRDINKDDRANYQIIKDTDSLISTYLYYKEYGLPLKNSKLFKLIFERLKISGDAWQFVVHLLKVIKYSIR